MKRRRSYFNKIVATFAFIIMLCGISASAEEFQYIVANNATYYESSYGFGSGRSAIVNEGNPYVTKPCYATINGYSFLDENGQIILSDYDESTNDISIPEKPEGAARLLLHFRTQQHRNGWVYAEAISPKEPKKITK